MTDPSTGDTERCENAEHHHETIGVGEDKDGTAFRTIECRECGVRWDSEGEWSVAQTTVSSTTDTDRSE